MPYKIHLISNSLLPNQSIGGNPSHIYLHKNYSGLISNSIDRWGKETSDYLPISSNQMICYNAILTFV